MKIVYYPKDQDGPGCYRCLYPAAQLAEKGGYTAQMGRHTILHEQEDFVSMSYDLNSALVDADIVVMAFPLEVEYCQFQKELQDRGIKVIIELDDDYLNLPDYNPAKRNTRMDAKTGPSVRHLLWCLQHADAVTVTTPALRDSIAKVTESPIYILRNFLDWRVWERRKPVCEDRSWQKLRIGYLGIANWHSGDLETLNPWFGEWVRDHKDVEFVSCDGSLHDMLGIPEDQRVTTSSYAFRHQEVADFAACQDIGLVPLVRNPFNEAKSHLKGMEYAGVGVPCLASPTESYREWWLSGRDEATSPGRGAGYLCSRPSEWIRALDLLRTDSELRTRLGRTARQLASENTYQDHWRMWEAAYLEVLNTGSPRSYADRTGKRVDAFGVRI